MDNSGTDEGRVLTLIADRLTRGRSQYGALDIAADRRDWLQETLEEVLDQAVYTAITLIRLRDLASRCACCSARHGGAT